MNKRKQLQEYENQIRQQQQLNKLKNNNNGGDAKFTEQDWQKLTPEELQELEQMLQEEYEEEEVDSTDSEFGHDDYENVEVHEFECIVCDKILK